jgi:hypothetical protein
MRPMGAAPSTSFTRWVGAGSPRWAPAAVAAASLALTACLDLDIPSVPDGGVGPSLQVTSPAAGATVTLVTLVAVNAASVEGIASVSVTCGSSGVPIAAWGAPPYSGLVDLSRCAAGASASDGGGIVDVVLHVLGVSTTGKSTNVDVPVHLDARTVAIHIDAPARVAPHTQLQAAILPDRPLAGPPTVAFDGNPASSVVPVFDGGVLSSYLATFTDTPGLGTDDGTIPEPVPIEVLTATERPALLSVDARSADNGNPTHVDLSLLLSRVVWDRPAPGRLALLAGSAVATGLGIHVPLATDDLVPTPSSRWLPGLLGASDGTYLPFDPTLLPGGLDGGYQAFQLDAKGDTLFMLAGSGLWFPPAATSTPPTVNLPGFARPLIRALDLLCAPDVFSPPGAGCLGAGTVQSVTCASPSQSGVVAAGSSPTLSLGQPTPGATLASGASYLAPAAPGCGDLWAFGPLGGGLSFASHADPARPACNLGAVLAALPVGDGSFIVALSGSCGGVPDFPILRVDSSGALRGAYVAPRASPAPVPVQPVAALPDGTLVTTRNAPPYTVFERWAEDGPSPLETSSLAGLYTTVPGQFPTVPANAVVGSDGTLTVLLSGGPNGAAVAHFGPGLIARWLYFYERTLVPASDAPALVGAPSLQNLYLLDTRNQRLVTLRAGGRSGDAGVLPPGDGGTVPDAGTDAGIDAGTDAGSGLGCLPPDGGPTTHFSVIANEVWTAQGSPHLVPNSITLTNVVQVEPCAQVLLGAGTTLSVDVDGSFLALGTVDQPIQIGPMSATAPFAALQAFGGGLMGFAYTSISGGGAPGSAIPDTVGTIIFQGVNNQAPTQQLLTVDHLTVTGSSSNGLVLEDGAGFTSGSNALTVSGSALFPVSIWSRAAGTLPPGTYTGNRTDEILIPANGGPEVVAETMTLHNRGVPYRIGNSISAASLQVRPPPASPALVTLTIEAGTILRFKPGGVMLVQPGQGTGPALGALVALGTAAQPIVFTSASVDPGPGDWLGIYFGLVPDPSNRMDNTRVEYAGGSSGAGSASCPIPDGGTPDGAIRIFGLPTGEFVTNTTIFASATNGIDRGWTSDTPTDFLNGNAFQAVAGCKQTLPHPATGICPSPAPCP